jgi:AcrR family transcriptional regulator
LSDWKPKQVKRKAGDTDLTDLEKLKEVIDDSGMTMTAIAAKSGIERGTLYNRLGGKGEFTVSEIIGLSEVLRLTKAERDNIFFSKKLSDCKH